MKMKRLRDFSIKNENEKIERCNREEAGESLNII
jgi:hypothetical protein